MSRIIAGSRGGRRIAVPSGADTRPTTDRVREALFSAVVSWAGRSAVPPEEGLTGIAFADLFAGSGAVGLEAGSRGAHPVLLVEAHRPTARLATRNATDLRLPASVQAARVEAYLSAVPDRAYDVVFLDPPYALPGPELDALLARIAEGWLAPSGLLVVERSTRTEPPRWPAGLEAWDRRYGETVLHFAAR